MQFLHPGSLVWAWLLVPVVLLFLVRRRPRTVRVSTLAFFKSLSEVYRESPWLRRLKRLLALALAAATLLAAIGALAHLVRAPASGAQQSLLIVLDGTASMGTTDADGRTRMEEARARLRTRLAGVDAGVSILLMRYDRRPEILLPHGLDRRALDRALQEVAIRPIEGDPETALVLAGRLAALQAPATIWHVTDQPRLPRTREDMEPVASSGSATNPDEGTATTDAPPLREVLRLPDDVVLETIDVGLPAVRNVGITAFQLRPRPLERGRFDAFVEIHAAEAGPVDTQLEVHVDGRLVSLRDLTLPGGGRERLLVPVEATTGSVLALSLRTAGDRLAADDRVIARIPELRPIRLLWVREGASIDPFTSLALAALGEDGVLEAFEAEPSAYKTLRERFDVVLFDGWLPEAWPTDTPALVMKPPRSLGPIRTAPIAGNGLPTETLRAIDDSHPVLFGVASARVALTQTAVLEADGSLAPLWVGDMGPLLVAGEVQGQRLVVMAFAPDRSEHLGLLASYPLLIGNAVFWLAAEEAEKRAGNNRRTGTLVDTGDAPLVWTDAAGVESRAEQPSSSAVSVLDRQGLWRIGAVHGSAALLSAAETAVRGPAPTEAGTVREAGGVLRGDLRPLLLWVTFFLLLLEAWLFHRRAVY